MSSTNKQTRFQNNNNASSSDASTKEQKLYNLLFAGKITMKEYLRTIGAFGQGEKSQQH